MRSKFCLSRRETNVVVDVFFFAFFLTVTEFDCSGTVIRTGGGSVEAESAIARISRKEGNRESDLKPTREN